MPATDDASTVADGPACRGFGRDDSKGQRKPLVSEVPDVSAKTMPKAWIRR
jgi:hypothetical protein